MFIGGVSAAAVLGSVRVASAQKKYSDGASDTEIKLGHTGPYSGPASSYGQIGKTIDAYWKSVNAAGGINGAHHSSRLPRLPALVAGATRSKSINAYASPSRKTTFSGVTSR